MRTVPPEKRADSAELFATIEMLKQESLDAGYAATDARGGWWQRLTGTTIHSTPWERRLQTAKKVGWINSDFLEEFMALVDAREPLEPCPRGTRGPAPRLSSQPLRDALRAAGKDHATYSTLPDEVTVFKADEVCIQRLGVHPAMVYGEDWWDVA